MSTKAKKWFAMLLAVFAITLVCSLVAQGNIPEIPQAVNGDDAVQTAQVGQDAGEDQSGKRRKNLGEPCG